MDTRVRLIGCGNPDAGDDAAGLEVVRRLRARVPPAVDVVEAGPATRVLDLLDGVASVVVVDAVRGTDGRRSPGALVRLDGSPEALRSSLASSLSSHGIGLAEAVGVASALGTAPRVVFHGVEVQDVAIGAPLSAAVKDSLLLLADAVLADVEAEASR
jgi:hydrogenase maturation protease